MNLEIFSWMPVLEGLPFDCFGWDEAGVCFFQNRICREKWGDLRGRQVADLKGSDQVAEFFRLHFSVARSGQQAETDLVCQVNGEQHFYRALIMPVRDAESTECAVLGIGIDITGLMRMHHPLGAIHSSVEAEGRRRAEELSAAVARMRKELEARASIEENLLQEKERYQALFEECPVGLWEQDCSDLQQCIDDLRAQGVRDFRAYFTTHPEEIRRLLSSLRQINVNQVTVRLFKAGSKSALLSGLSRNFPSTLHDAFLDGLTAFAEGENRFESQATYYTFSGEEGKLDIKWVVLPDTHSPRTRLLTSLADITEIKNTENKLRLFKNISDHSNIGCVVTDYEHTILYINDALAAMHGYEVAELAGRKTSLFHSREEIDRLRGIFDRRVSAGSVTNVESCNMRKDGSVFPALMSTLVLGDELGGTEVFATLVIDMSDRKAAEEKMRNHEKELELNNLRLSELNTAMRVVLDRREEEKKELERKLKNNIQELILPTLDRLRRGLDTQRQIYADLLEAELQAICSSLVQSTGMEASRLTPDQLLMARLIKEGKTTKEIAEAMNLSVRSVETYRYRIRLRLGITSKKVNLRKYLLSLDP